MVIEIKAALLDDPKPNQWSTGTSLVLYTQPIDESNLELLEKMLATLFKDGVKFTLKTVKPTVAATIGEMVL